MLYLLSFMILFGAEICSTLHSLYAIKNSKQGAAVFGALSSALWCVKIIVIVSQPLTIVTAFVGAYFGSLVTFFISEKLSPKI